MPNSISDQAIVARGPTSYEFGQPLVAVDRCDRCGAQAHVASLHVLPADRDGGRRAVTLLWCAHHARQHHAKFAELDIEMFDPEHQLKPAVHAA